jgi:Na+-translocating ferredoxin:NAD+ oxidoreductase RnfD subunit
LQQKLSAWIGIAGGIIDLVVGASLTQNPPPAVMAQAMMSSQSDYPIGYAVFAFGIVVLATGLYLLFTRMMHHRAGFGFLMVLYGIVMLVLGAGMIRNVFLMMQYSLLSGIVMIIVGLTMLYSGSEMIRK